MSYELAYGPIPNGMCVLHRCDNPGCVRPDHLFLGTMRDNTQDCIQKGRFNARGNEPKGSANGCSKLTESDVALIRERRRQGCQVAHLARDFKVAVPTIEGVIARKSWRHVP